MIEIAAPLKQQALALARAAIEEQVLGRRSPPAADLQVAISGLFVSLHIAGMLRGCIGTTVPEPLGPAVQRLAVAAATRDPRFSPVIASELDALAIEISVLTPPEPIAGPGDVTVGVHGLTVEDRDRRGLLLPQVASDRGMTADEFVTAVCQKAGIERGQLGAAGVVLSRFRAEVFGER